MPSSPFPVFVTYQKGDTVHRGASENPLFVLTPGLCSASPTLPSSPLPLCLHLLRKLKDSVWSEEEKALEPEAWAKRL